MQLHTLHTSEKGPVILWGMYEFRERELLNTYETIKRLTGDCDYTLIAFEVTDWNCEFSPWKSKEVDASFGGEASHTLAVLRNEYLPQIKEQIWEGTQHLSNGLFTGWSVRTVGNVRDGCVCRGRELFRIAVVSAVRTLSNSAFE